MTGKKIGNKVNFTCGVFDLPKNMICKRNDYLYKINLIKFRQKKG